MLKLVYWNTKIFVGKMEEGIITNRITDVVDFAAMFHPQHGMILNGVLVGNMAIPENSITVDVTKDSPYWQAYFQASGKLNLGK